MQKVQDRLALWAIQGVRCWLPAIEVTEILKWRLATQYGVQYSWSWRPVSFALRRLARQGLVEERVVTYRGTSRTKEERREYRFAKDEEDDVIRTLFPLPKPAPAHVPRRVHRMDG